MIRAPHQGTVDTVIRAYPPATVAREDVECKHAGERRATCFRVRAFF
jgi:hypothetical protein